MCNNAFKRRLGFDFTVIILTLYKALEYLSKHCYVFLIDKSLFT